MLVGDSAGTLSMYQVKEKQFGVDSPRSFTFSSHGVNRKESMEPSTPSEMKKTVLEYSSPALESSNSPLAEDEKKFSKDQKYSFGYFINRNRYYKQNNPQFMLELIGIKTIENGLAIKDIKISRAQTHIYMLLSDSSTKVLYPIVYLASQTTSTPLKSPGHKSAAIIKLLVLINIIVEERCSSFRMKPGESRY